MRGCLNLGRELPWAKLYRDERAAELTRQIQALATEADPAQRVLLLRRLSLLTPQGDEIKALYTSLQDKNAEVRIQTVQTLGQHGGLDTLGILREYFATETSPQVKAALLNVLARRHAPGVDRLITQVLEDPASAEANLGPIPDAIRLSYTAPTKTHGLPSHPTRKAMSPVGETAYSGTTISLEGKAWTLKLAAIEAAAGCECKGPVPSLIATLTQEDPLSRTRAAKALRRITNHSARLNWAKAKIPKGARRRGLEEWASWHKKHGSRSREQWLVQGFRDKKFKVRKISKRSIWEITRAISSNDYISWNAQQSLSRMTRHHPDSLHWSKPRATRYWTRWLDRRRKTLGLPRCPAPLPCRKK